MKQLILIRAGTKNYYIIKLNVVGAGETKTVQLQC